MENQNFLDLKEHIKTLPLTSGVYLMKNISGKIIYIGKAVSLRKRVQSYFRKTGTTKTKTDVLVSEISRVEIIGTDSEAEALILEASLIKTYKPRFNILLLDDKSYPLIEITKEPFPKISIQRPKVRREDVIYYGPYVNASLIREALTIIRKIFPFRTCEPFPKKECLDYHIYLCEAPCIQKVSQKEYKKNVKNVMLILEGKKDILLRRLREEMESLSQKRDYEQAAKVRDQLKAIGALYSGTKDLNYYKEAEQLQRILKLDRAPGRIETFDISHVMGQQTVASMVSFLNGTPDKKNYRRYKIKTVEGIDDFKSMAEVVRRRYQRLKKEGLAFPDLIVVDGGKGQLSAAYAELVKLEVNIPMIALAKRQEEIFIPKSKIPIVLSKHLLGLQLLQRTRDEAHRFAVTFHKKLRAKNVFK